MIFRILVQNLKQLSLSQSSHQLPLSLASEIKCEITKIVAIDAFIDELIECKETVAAADSQTDDSIRIILKKDIESRSLPPIDVLRFNGDPSK